MQVEEEEEEGLDEVRTTYYYYSFSAAVALTYCRRDMESGWVRLTTRYLKIRLGRGGECKTDCQEDATFPSVVFCVANKQQPKRYEVGGGGEGD
eukprot:scaffold6852_cov215-Ochromonas_danica.AAC.21